MVPQRCELCKQPDAALCHSVTEAVQIGGYRQVLRSSVPKRCSKQSKLAGSLKAMCGLARF